MNTSGTFRRIVRRLLPLAAVTALLASPAYAQKQQAGAGKNPAPPPEPQQFPPEHPAFRFDLPAGWTVDRGNEDKATLICNLKGRADIGLVCVAVPQIFSLDDFASILPGLAHDQLDRQNLADLQIVSQGTDQAGACPAYFVITKGKLKDRSMSVTFIGLVSAQGRGYLMEYVLPSVDGPAHMKDFQTIIKSLAPINP